MFIGISVYLLQMLNLGVLFHFLLGYQLQQNRMSRICATLMIATGLGVQILYYDNMPPLLGIFFLDGILVALPVIVFKGNCLRMLLLSINFRCIYSAVYGLMEGIFSIGSLIEVPFNLSLITQGIFLLAMTILSCSLHESLGKIHCSVERMNRGMLVLFLICLLVARWKLYATTDEVENVVRIYIGQSKILLAVIVLFLLISVAFIHWMGERNRELLYLNQLNQKYMDEQAKQYRNLEEKDLTMRRFRHDYKSHMTALRYYLQNAEYEAAVSYLAELEEVEIATEYISTGNMIGDAVINQYAERGKNEQIEFDYHGRIPTMESVKETHFCALFSNAVCNAYEATLDVEGQRIITIRVTHQGGYLFVSVKNPVANRLRFYEGRLLTGKEDTHFHGFGTKNMKEIAEHYHGDVTWKERNGIVETKIHLKYTE